MFWADTIADEVERRYESQIKAGVPIVVRDEKTASGKVHVGSLRSASLHAVVADVLRSRGHDVKFYFEINDFDAMDGIPSYLDESEYQKYMGVPLCNIPSPEPGFANFAEYYGQEYVNVLNEIGFVAEIYRASDLYKSGVMNEMITKALQRKDLVREIYYRISKSEKPVDWYPLNVVCQNCGNVSATKITSFDGELVEYVCSSDTIAWATGCEHVGKVSPYNGNAKFPWKLDWAAKFVAKGVLFEGGGKDHYSKGGSRQVAEAIAREIFDHEPPYGVFNEFFLVGGKKMSSSKGNAASAKAMSTILPPHILRLLLLKTPINRQIDFDPEGDAIPVLYDLYDRLAEKYWSGTKDDDSQLFTFSHLPDERSDISEKRFLPRFSQVAFLVQMPHMDIYAELAKMKEGKLTDIDVAELDDRIKYAKHWLKEYADDKFIFTLQTTLPEAATSLTESQLSALAILSDKIASFDSIDGQVLHELIHEVKAESGLTPQEFFGAIYTVLLGKDSGPKVGWFLSTLDKEFLVKRLRGEG
jgi:lysyl-tRNA synthetase class 1